MTENRKIKNATPVTSEDGIDMKSKTELRIYNALLSLGIKPEYESERFVYWKGPRPTILFYDMHTNKEKDEYRHLRKNMKKMVDMSYTPDFVFMYKGVKVILEVKGWENDQFSIRKKLFRSYLETLKDPVVYAEIFTKRQLLEFMEELEKQIPILKKRKSMIQSCRRRSPETKYVVFDGENLEEVVTLLHCEDKVSLDSYIEGTPATVCHPSIGNFTISKDNVIVLEGNMVFVFNDKDKFDKYFEDDLTV